jgi:hypothetical protein
MATLDDLFTQYLSSIEPSPLAVSRAQAAHGPLRADLEKDDAFGAYVGKTVLSGSYGRGTSTFHIKDVDVIIQTTLTIKGLQDKKRPDETEQYCLLRLTQEAITRAGRHAGTRKARRSIHVELPEEVNNIGQAVPALTMDIVPVLLQRGEDRDPMTIADCELKGWYDTYPATQLSDSETRNAKSTIIQGRHSYKPLVKIFKAWKQVHFDSNKTPKGFVLECLTARYHNPRAERWVEAVRDLFQNICDEWPDPEWVIAVPEVPDISNSATRQIPIAKSPEDARKVLRKIHQHLALVKQAIEEAGDDLTKSAKTLQRVFGQDPVIVCFPLPAEDNDSGSGTKGGGKLSPFVPKGRSDVREAPAFGDV